MKKELPPHTRPKTNQLAEISSNRTTDERGMGGAQRNKTKTHRATHNINAAQVMVGSQRHLLVAAPSTFFFSSYFLAVSAVSASWRRSSRNVSPVSSLATHSCHSIGPGSAHNPKTTGRGGGVKSTDFNANSAPSLSLQPSKSRGRSFRVCCWIPIDRKRRKKYKRASEGWTGGRGRGGERAWSIYAV